MFESIFLTKPTISNPESPIDLGFLAETMLFYRDVHVLVSRQGLRQITRACGPETLIELLERRYLRLIYQHELGGVQTENTNTANERHTPVFFRIERQELQHIAPEIFADVTGRSGKGRRLAQRFIPLVSELPYNRSVLSDVKADFLDEHFSDIAVGELLRLVAPEYEAPERITFRIFPEGEHYRVSSNINFDLVNQSYHKRIPKEHSSMSPAYILSHILSCREHLAMSANLSAEIAVDAAQATLMKARIQAILKPRAESARDINSFFDLVFDDARPVREAINSGEKSMREFMEVLQEAGKWRGWLNERSPDTTLVKEYFRAATANSWVDKLPTRSIRWAIFTGAGLGLDALGAGGVGTALGIGVSAADAFLLDKLIRGWKPHQFVQGPLARFVKRTE